MHIWFGRRYLLGVASMCLGLGFQSPAFGASNGWTVSPSIEGFGKNSMEMCLVNKGRSDNPVWSSMSVEQAGAACTERLTFDLDSKTVFVTYKGLLDKSEYECRSSLGFSGPHPCSSSFYVAIDARGERRRLNPELVQRALDTSGAFRQLDVQLAQEAEEWKIECARDLKQAATLAILDATLKRCDGEFDSATLAKAAATRARLVTQAPAPAPAVPLQAFPTKPPLSSGSSENVAIPRPSDQASTQTPTRATGKPDSSQTKPTTGLRSLGDFFGIPGFQLGMEYTEAEKAFRKRFPRNFTGGGHYRDRPVSKLTARLTEPDVEAPMSLHLEFAGERASSQLIKVATSFNDVQLGLAHGAEFVRKLGLAKMAETTGSIDNNWSPLWRSQYYCFSPNASFAVTTGTSQTGVPRYTEVTITWDSKRDGSEPTCATGKYDGRSMLDMVAMPTAEARKSYLVRKQAEEEAARQRAASNKGDSSSWSDEVCLFGWRNRDSSGRKICLQ